MGGKSHYLPQGIGIVDPLRRPRVPLPKLVGITFLPFYSKQSMLIFFSLWHDCIDNLIRLEVWCLFHHPLLLFLFTSYLICFFFLFQSNLILEYLFFSSLTEKKDWCSTCNYNKLKYSSSLIFIGFSYNYCFRYLNDRDSLATVSVFHVT